MNLNGVDRKMFLCWLKRMVADDGLVPAVGAVPIAMMPYIGHCLLLFFLVRSNLYLLRLLCFHLHCTECSNPFPAYTIPSLPYYNKWSFGNANAIHLLNGPHSLFPSKWQFVDVIAFQPVIFPILLA